MTDKGMLEKSKIKPALGSHMVGGRTYRNIASEALTTNNIEPQQPACPAVRKPAAGPLITTENTEPKKPAEKVDADFKADAKEKKGKK